MDSELFPATLRAAREGSEHAWSEIYAELAGSLMAYAGARGARDAGDVVGEVFLEIARRIHEFEGSWDAFRGWAFLTASRRVIDEHRRLARRPETLHAESPDSP
ncbi:MAG TPA: sigma factor, partial [Acidimicrobiales bacterium]|nr:sigma factor [Acidimicrobiales bacterium]